MHVVNIGVANAAYAEKGITIDRAREGNDNRLDTGQEPTNEMHVTTIARNGLGRPFHTGGKEPCKCQHDPPEKRRSISNRPCENSRKPP